MPKRKICVVTGSRAEHGLLHSLLKDLQADAELDLQLVVTGMHLSSRFGSTYMVIERDFTIDIFINKIASLFLSTARTNAPDKRSNSMAPTPSE